MIRKKLSAFGFLGGLLLIIAVTVLVPVVEAQCGSQTSTCKDCHEVQGQAPVNHDGTGWHESHAFGDFCTICHAGNQQATDKDTAHLGMVPPLSDVQASCQSCHTDDVQQRAQIYAKVLGIEVGSGEVNPELATLVMTPISTEPPATEQAVAVIAPTQASVCTPGGTQLAVDDPNSVDYVLRYNEIVLGEHPVNWGNVALVGLIGAVILGGGGFVLFNEAKLRKSSADTEMVEGEYPPEVVELLPALTNLKSQSRKSLKRILSHPEKSDRVLGLIDAVVSDDDQPEE